MPASIGYGSANLSSLAQLTRTNQALGTQSAQISSGRRITNAAIDPAALAVFVELDTESMSNRAAIGNANQAMSIVQTAEGASGAVTDNLQRMRELAVQSASGTLNDDQRASIQDEFAQLQAEIDRVSGSTDFNGQQLADGSQTELEVQVGTTGDATSRVEIGLTDLSTGALGVGALDVSTAGGAQASLDAIDDALSVVSEQRSDLGSTFNRLESSVAYATDRGEALAESASRIMDADFATLLSEQTGNTLLQQANTSALVQSRNVQRTAIMGLLT